MVDIKVGPTNCDKDRNARDAWINILTKKLSKRVDKKTSGAMRISTIFFREAMCRNL